MQGIEIVRTVEDLRARVDAWRADGLRVGLVPTMGALHEGHLSLVRQSKAATDRTVVTLFVNPRQFGPNEDLDVYPRTEERDAALLTEEGADLLFAPGVDVMYPDGAVTVVSVPGLGDILEGEFRPGFFDGVATIVTKLLLQARAHVAFFGEKDYQQLQVIRRLAADLDIDVQIEAGETVRETDGLALSSRNVYLSEAERASAPALHNAMNELAEAVRGGGDVAAAEKEAQDAVLAAGFASIDYLTVRDGATLQPVAGGHNGAKRIVAAAWMGKTRLIDNISV